MKLPGSFIRWPRALRETGILQDPRALQVYMWAFLEAAYRPWCRVLPGGRPIHLLPGQCVFTLGDIVRDLGLPKSTAHNIINRLKRWRLIKVERLPGPRAGQGQSLLTVLDYPDYQSADDPGGTPTGTPIETPAEHHADATRTPRSGNPDGARDPGAAKNSRREELKKGERSGPPDPDATSSPSQTAPRAHALAEAERLARQLGDLQAARNPGAPPSENSVRAWAGPIFLAFEQLGLTASRIELAIGFSQQDDFWSGYIRDGQSLFRHLRKAAEGDGKLLVQAEAWKAKHADEEQVRRAQRVTRRPHDPESVAFTPDGCQLALESIGQVMDRLETPRQSKRR